MINKNLIHFVNTISHIYGTSIPADPAEPTQPGQPVTNVRPTPEYLGR